MTEFEALICEMCSPPHAMNCPDCFGWGFKANGSIVNAGDMTLSKHGRAGLEVYRNELAGAKRCEKCLGHPDGREPVPFAPFRSGEDTA